MWEESVTFAVYRLPRDADCGRGTHPSLAAPGRVLPSNRAERRRDGAVPRRGRPAAVLGAPPPRRRQVRCCRPRVLPDGDALPRRGGRGDGPAVARRSVPPESLCPGTQCAPPTPRRPLLRAL